MAPNRSGKSENSNTVEEDGLMCEGDKHCDGKWPMLWRENRVKMGRSLPQLHNSLHLYELADVFEDFVRSQQPSRRTTAIRFLKVPHGAAAAAAGVHLVELLGEATSSFSHKLPASQSPSLPFSPGSPDKKAFVRDLRRFLQEQYPGSKLEVFGSSKNGFATESSDLDLTLVFAEGSREADTFRSGSNGDKIKLLFQVTSVLTTSRKKVNIRDIEAVPRARVKIVKFISYKHHFAVDLSFSNHLALRNTALLNEYTKYEPLLVSLVVILKKIIKESGNLPSRAGGISSYAYSLMMIFYLQQKGYLPCLQHVRAIGTEHNRVAHLSIHPSIHPSTSPTTYPSAYVGDTKPNIIEDDCNVWFQTDRDVVKSMWKAPTGRKTVADLWLGFLRFYLFEFEWFKYNVAIDSLDLVEIDNTTECISIMDPFDTLFNLTRNTMPMGTSKEVTHPTTCQLNNYPLLTPPPPPPPTPPPSHHPQSLTHSLTPSIPYLLPA
nr:terminal uridylyltransferase 7 [Hymenolepis microstoma]